MRNQDEYMDLLIEYERKFGKLEPIGGVATSAPKKPEWLDEFEDDLGCSKSMMLTLLLSDAQEAMDFGDTETARRRINTAKQLIWKILKDSPDSPRYDFAAVQLKLKEENKK